MLTFFPHEKKVVSTTTPSTLPLIPLTKDESRSLCRSIFIDKKIGTKHRDCNFVTDIIPIISSDISYNKLTKISYPQKKSIFKSYRRSN